jgi:hypothetical protein
MSTAKQIPILWAPCLSHFPPLVTPSPHPIHSLDLPFGNARGETEVVRCGWEL